MIMFTLIRLDNMAWWWPSDSVNRRSPAHFLMSRCKYWAVNWTWNKPKTKEFSNYGPWSSLVWLTYEIFFSTIYDQRLHLLTSRGFIWRSSFEVLHSSLRCVSFWWARRNRLWVYDGDSDWTLTSPTTQHLYSQCRLLNKYINKPKNN